MVNNTKKDIRVPRYTSYPTALEFDRFSGQEYQQWLQSLNKKEGYSLYLHIPYCEEMCLFCGCFTKITKHRKPIEDYINYLVKEIKLVASHIDTKIAIKHVHFGGGSPSLLSPKNLSIIMDSLRENFHFLENIEIAMEIDPRTTDYDKIQSYAKEGFNRISMGIQDFDPKVQEAVNRIHSFEDIEQIFHWLRESGINNINADIMYGLPYQNNDIIKNTLDKIISLSPSRIAAFAYAHVPWMRKHQRLIPQEAIPGGKERLEMIRLINYQLNQASYVTVGIDHFAKQSDSMAIGLHEKNLRRNFQGYTTDKADNLIGLGISSIGSLPKGFIQNETNMTTYKQLLDQDELPITRGYSLKGNDLIIRDIISQIMCYQKVNLEQIITKYNLPNDIFDKNIKLINQIPSLASVDEKNITIKDHIFARKVAAVFDHYIDKKTLNELLFNSDYQYLDVM